MLCVFWRCLQHNRLGRSDVNAEGVYHLLMIILMIFSAVMSAIFLLRSEYEDRGSPWVWAAAFALTSLGANVLFVDAFVSL